MTWPFEHWDNGKVYLHNENWDEFKSEVNTSGYREYKHDWNHKRLFLKIHSPVNNIKDIWMPAHASAYTIEETDSWGVVYEPFPAFYRSWSDPEGWLCSWHIWAEKDLSGFPNSTSLEKVTLLETRLLVDSALIFYSSSPSISHCPLTLATDRNQFVYFRDQYWQLDQYEYLGIGTSPPLLEKKKKQIFRNIFDD